MECKAPLGVRGGASGRGLSEAQEAWLRSWRGGAPILARTTDDAVAAVLDALKLKGRLVPVTTAWDDDFDLERQELDDEREALHMAWLAATPPKTGNVEFSLGAHKKAPGVSA
jgi:2-phospho-L-lactate transferase/gluconeogenesis factor (CofD/UPF0052 family)